MKQATKPKSTANLPKRQVLMVIDCGLRWPTGMVRAMQFKPLFDSSEMWHADFVSRHSEFLANVLGDSRKLHWRIIRRICGPLFRLVSDKWAELQDKRILKRAPKYDIVCIVKSPCLDLYRQLCKIGHPRILMDVNDALWLQKSALWSDLDAMLTEVHGVICENSYIANYVKKWNEQTFVIDDAPQVEVFDRWRDQIHRNPDEIVIGWIGGASNIGPLYKLLDPLEALFARFPQLRLRVLGAPQAALPPFEQVRVSCLPSYSQEDMVREVLKFDIGLFPLFHTEDARARGTLKAKIYMSGQAVAVCENYGENPELIQDGYNGLLASTPQEWHDKLEWLITNPHSAGAIAKQGLDAIRKQYTAKFVFERMLAVYEQVGVAGSGMSLRETPTQVGHIAPLSLGKNRPSSHDSCQ